MATSPKAKKAAPTKEPAESAKEMPAANIPASKPQAKPKKWLFILVGALLGFVLGGVSAFMLTAYGPMQQQVEAEILTPPVLVELETFVVNLDPDISGNDYFLQVTMALRVQDEHAANRIKLLMPQVRSRLLVILSNKKASELSNKKGKQHLSEEIIEQLGMPFTDGSHGLHILDVFYTSFVIQQQ